MRFAPSVVRRLCRRCRSVGDGGIVLASFEQCLRDKRVRPPTSSISSAEQPLRRRCRNMAGYGRKSRKGEPYVSGYDYGEIDASFDLPYTRLPHPRYRGKTIRLMRYTPFGEYAPRMFRRCAFCTISAHQGKFIASRSKESIMREVSQ